MFRNNCMMANQIPMMCPMMGMGGMFCCPMMMNMMNKNMMNMPFEYPYEDHQHKEHSHCTCNERPMAPTHAPMMPDYVNMRPVSIEEVRD